jgi:hypothetical protein
VWEDWGPLGSCRPRLVQVLWVLHSAARAVHWRGRAGEQHVSRISWGEVVMHTQSLPAQVNV